MVLVRVWVTFKCSFPIRGATVQSVFGVAGHYSLAGLPAFLELMLRLSLNVMSIFRINLLAPPQVHE